MVPWPSVSHTHGSQATTPTAAFKMKSASLAVTSESGALGPVVPAVSAMGSAQAPGGGRVVVVVGAPG